MKNNTKELLATLDKIRSQNHPEISMDIIKRIVQIQTDYQDEPGKREIEVHKALAEYVAATKEE